MRRYTLYTGSQFVQVQVRVPDISNADPASEVLDEYQS
jgi:hypothetical protein